jgi:uncharacterized protein YndB with AHSA1/START domain
MSEGLRIEVTLPGSVEDVWPAFREPDLLRQWHGWEDPSLDDEIRMIFADGTVVEDDGRTLHVGGHRFTFEPLGAQTIVRVTRATPPSGGDMDWDAYYDDIDEGWLSFLQQLRFARTYHWHETRHTVHLDGTTTDPTTAPAALGLGVEGDPGTPYAADVAGEHLTGAVWFRSTHQLGLTVDGWGPGLLVMADAPNAGGLAASATLTTYGPIDGDREARWTRVWRAAYAG